MHAIAHLGGALATDDGAMHVELEEGEERPHAGSHMSWPGAAIYQPAMTHPVLWLRYVRDLVKCIPAANQDNDAGGHLHLHHHQPPAQDQSLALQVLGSALLGINAGVLAATSTKLGAAAPWLEALRGSALHAVSARVEAGLAICRRIQPYLAGTCLADVADVAS